MSEKNDATARSHVAGITHTIRKLVPESLIPIVWCVGVSRWL